MELPHFIGYTDRHTKALACVCAVFHSPIPHIRLHLLIWNCFGSDTNQCTSQVNPGEIEIHLQTCDHNQWWRNHMEACLPQLQKHKAMTQWGTTVEGKAVHCSVGGAGGAQERTHGVEFRELTQTDRGWHVVEVRWVVICCEGTVIWLMQSASLCRFKIFKIDSWRLIFKQKKLN